MGASCINPEEDQDIYIAERKERVNNCYLTI